MDFSTYSTYSTKICLVSTLRYIIYKLLKYIYLTIF